MKRYIIILVMLFLCTPASAAEYRLSTALEKDSAGYAALERVIREIFRRAGGHTVDIVPLPPERALVEADAGRTDGDTARFHGIIARYPNLVEVPEPLYRTKLNVYVTNPDIRSVKREDLPKYTIVYVRGHRVFEPIAAELDRKKVITAPSAESGVRMLAAGRAELLISIGFATDDAVRKVSRGGIRKLEKPLLSAPVHLILNRKHEKIIPSICRTIQAMEADGTIERLLKGTYRAQKITPPHRNADRSSPSP